MKIVIDIPESEYEIIMKHWGGYQGGCYSIYDSIKEGIPLPKGHGDLITKEQAIELVEFYEMNPQHFDFVNLIDEIKDEKPIIEADNSESE